MTTEVKQDYFEELDNVFPSKLGYQITSQKEGVYHVETSEHHGFMGEQLVMIPKIGKLHVSQTFKDPIEKNTINMTILDLAKTDSHTSFYGYNNEKAHGRCYICGKQTNECRHEYTRASSIVRNCNVCELHEFCRSCKKETCGVDMCIGNLCSKCYNEDDRRSP